jgi:hypothetical protein
MANDRQRSIMDYLQTNTGFNDENFRIIREQYRQQCGGSFPTLLNESAADQVAEQLNITFDTREGLDLLHYCFSSAEINYSRVLVEEALANIRLLQNGISVEKKHITTTITNNGMMKLFYELDK